MDKNVQNNHVKVGVCKRCEEEKKKLTVLVFARLVILK